MPKVNEHEVKEVKWLKADDRGRVTLGPDYADEYVPVAVLKDDPAAEGG